MEENKGKVNQQENKEKNDDSIDVVLEYAKATWQNPEFVEKYEKMYSDMYGESSGEPKKEERDDEEFIKKTEEIMSKMSSKASKAVVDYLNGMLTKDPEELERVNSEFTKKIINGEFSKEDSQAMGKIIESTIESDRREKLAKHLKSKAVDEVVEKYARKVKNGEITEEEARRLAFEECEKNGKEKDNKDEKSR